MKKLDKVFIVVAILPIILTAGLLSTLIASVEKCYEYNKEITILPEEGYPYEYKKGNLSYLLEIARAFEKLIVLYHLPYDTIVTVRFNSTAMNVSEARNFDLFNPNASEMKILGYGGLGDSAIWSGVYLAAESFRYAVAKNVLKNETEAEEALNNVRRVLKGIWRLVKITPDGSLARFVAPYTNETINLIGEHFFGDYDDGHEHRWATWNDSEDYKRWETTKWGWEGTTSKDQYSGVLFGLGVAYDLVPVDDVRERIKDTVDTILSYFIRTNWKSLQQDKTHAVGSDLSNNWFGAGLFLIGYLKIGAHILPEKYKRLYYYYAIDRGYAYTLIRAYNTPNINWQYYGFNLNFLVYFNLLRLEEDEKLRNIYLEAFLKTNWELVKYHRNAWFDLVYMSQTGNWSKLYIMDVIDCLVRFIEGHYPHRNYPIDNTNLPENPVEYPSGLNLGPLSQIAQGITDCRPHTKWPLPADRREPDTFIWQRSPFIVKEEGDGSVQYPGIDYTLVFWMLYYYKLFDRAYRYGFLIA